MAVLDVRLLGGLVVEFDGAAVELPASRPARALLAWLALRSGPHTRSRLAALLWPDVLDASARASLRSALWALRVALGPAAGGYLRTGRDLVELAGDGLSVDVHEFRRLLTAGCPAEAVAPHRGDLLSEFDLDWVLDARDEQRQRLGDAYGTLAATAEADGDLAGARGWAIRRAAGQPLDEQAARELIRLLTAAGDQAGAAVAYHRFAARLDAELGISPAAETSGMISGLRRTSPPAAAPGPAAPGPGAPLIGRTSELRALRRHWRAARGGGTAVAISGDGGMGKTRLVRELLAAAAAEGAWTATGTAGGPGAAAPFALWSELLEDLLAQADAGNWPRCARTSPRLAASMPEFELHARSDAPPEDVWKLLYDPGRFPDWWAGVGSVDPGQAGEYTMYPEGYPEFPMPQQLRVSGSGVTISCLVSDLVFEWRLAPLDDGAATSITVHVEIPSPRRTGWPPSRT